MRCIIAILAFTVFASTSAAQTPTPVMEYVSALDGLDVYHRTGKIQVRHDNVVVAAFLPAGAKVDVAFTKKGEKTPFYVHPFRLSPWYGLFTNLISSSTAKEYFLTEPGDYVATYRANGKPMTSIPFTLFVESDGDVFNPKKFYYVKGPWNNMAYMFAPLDKPDGQPEFRMWGRKVTFVEGRDADRYTVELRKDGDIIADGGGYSVASQEWLHMKFPLKHTSAKGGTVVKASELLAVAGTYHIIVKNNSKLHAVYPFTIKDNQPVLHKRQASDYKPRTEYLVPRFSGETPQADGAGNILWMDRLSDKDAKAVFEGKAIQVVGPSDAQRKNWMWLPTADHKRPFQLTTTEIETRSDTFIDTGDDVIAFGTGYPNGVKYMLAGDKQAREIPDGETYSSTVFRVCGKKIVLVKGKQLVVFDTTTRSLTPIDGSDITLYNVTGGLHRANHVNADGYLITTINDVTKVADKTILKIVDISGPKPVIIPIKNADYTQSDVSSVAIDVKQGMAAVSSWQKKSLYYATIGNLANQTKVDMTDHRGVDRNQIFISDESIVYADNDDKIRYLNLESGKNIPVAITEEAFGRSGNSLYVNRNIVAVSTAEKFGTRYQFAIGELPNKPTIIPGTGTPIEGTSGKLGMAGCAAICYDRTVFLAGTPSGGIGVGEHLQVLDKQGGSWKPVLGQDGKALSAIDVTASLGMLAFKTKHAKTGKTVIGYATFGKRINLDEALAVVSTKPDSKQTSPNNKPAPTEKPKGLSELEKAYVQSYVDTEKELAKAYASAFGEKESRKKARQGILDTMKKNKHEHLIEHFKKAADGK